MQRLFLMLLIVFLAQSLTAQNILQKQSKDGIWGYVDTSGAVVIDFQYRVAYDFIGATAVVKKDSLFGFINTNNEVVVPFEYEAAQLFVSSQFVKLKKGGKWYLFNLRGERISKKAFDEIGRVFSGKMTVRQGDRYGFMNNKGDFILKPKYEAVYYNGGGLVQVKKRGKYGYKTIEGKKAVPIKFEAIGRFYGSRAKAKHKGMWGIIDKKGKKILKFRFEYIGEYEYDTFLKDYYAPYVYGTRVGKISSWGAAVPFEYNEIADESIRLDEELVMIRFGKDYGVVDNYGRVVIVPLYKNLIAFSEGVAAVTNGQNFGFIDKTGKTVYPFELEKAENFEDGKAKVVKNGKEEILDIEAVME